MKNNPNFIAPVGPASSGKDHLIQILKDRGYERVSLSDSIRDDLDKLHPGRRHTRSDFQDYGDKMRLEYGNDYWAQRAGENIEVLKRSGATKFAIDSIRNPAEIEWFKKTYGLIAIAVDAPLELRIKWAFKRQRNIDDTISEDNIRRDFERDLGIGQPEHGQNVRSCIEMSDQLIINDETEKELDEKLRDALLSIGVEGNHNHREKK